MVRLNRGLIVHVSETCGVRSTAVTVCFSAGPLTVYACEHSYARDVHPTVHHGASFQRLSRGMKLTLKEGWGNNDVPSEGKKPKIVQLKNCDRSKFSS